MLDEMVFQAIPDESSIVAGLRTGQVTMAEFLSALSYQVARGVASLVAVQAPSTRWVVLDLADDQEPTSRLEVRQAIALAIDRQAILQIAGSGLGQRLGVLPPGMKFWALSWQELPNQQRDVAKAKALLQKAGFTWRVSMKMRNIVGFPPWPPRWAQAARREPPRLWHGPVDPGHRLEQLLGQAAMTSPEVLASFRRFFGLDRPLIVQYMDWLTGILCLLVPGRPWGRPARIDPGVRRGRRGARRGPWGHSDPSHPA